MSESSGYAFRQALSHERPLQIAGAVNAYCAMLAQQAGFQALYLSGAGVANASFGLPDLGLTTLNDVVEDVHRITGACKLPLLVDADTGWGGAFMMARSVVELSRAGAAGIHIEDQVQAKRCGHRPNKALVNADEMADRIKAAVDARVDEQFVIMARTDARASEGMSAAIERACRYIEAGADMIFAEALLSPEEFVTFTAAVKVPVLGNMTEFGKTPLMNIDDFRRSGVAMVLYPLSAFRAMSFAAMGVYQAIRQDGSQQSWIEKMQTRSELYEVLGYHVFENKLDELFSREEK